MTRKPPKTRLLPIITLIEWIVVACLGVMLVFLIIFYRQFSSTAINFFTSSNDKPQTPIISPTAPTDFTEIAVITPIETSEQLHDERQNTEVPSITDENNLRGKIAYTCTPDKYDQICLMRADGTDQKRLTNRETNDYYPTIAPDGKSVLFASNQSGRYEINMLQLSTGLEMKITNGPGNLSAPHISSNGEWIIFSAEFNQTNSIWKLQQYGSLPIPLTQGKWDETNPAWSPDNERIAFTSNRTGFVELYIMDKDGNHIHQITRPPTMIEGRISWSPDNKSLSFSAGPRGDRNIFMLQIETGDIIQITFGGNNRDPSFSPDGNWIAFSSSRDGDHEIFIIQSDGSNLIQLTNNSIDDWQPSWGN